MRGIPLVAALAACLAGSPLQAAAGRCQGRADQLIAAAWAEQVDVATARNGRTVAPSGAKADEAKRFYVGMLDRLFASGRVQCVLALDDTVREHYLQGRSELNRRMAANSSSLARAFDATAANPVGTGLVERSGFSDLVGVALRGSHLLASDATALTLDLAGFGRLRSSDRDERLPAALRYREQGFANRLAGSVTLGAKLPQSAIVGFSGFPDADKLFDTVGWDAKLRLVGDRDPRAAHWDNLLLGRLGGDASIGASVLGDARIPLADRHAGGALNDALAEVVGRDVAAVERAIRSSLQVSIKVSGQHLAHETGMNRYSGTLLVDKGFGPFDLSGNASYSTTQDVPTPTGGTVTLSQWKMALGAVGTVWKGALVPGLGAEASAAVELVVPVQRSAVPDRRKTWKAEAALTVPVNATVQLPFSVTYSNDPNNLSKKRFVTGRFGLNYDFGSLKKLLAGE